MKFVVGYRRMVIGVWLLLGLFFLSGCGILFGGREPEPTPTEAPRALVPTFTPTPEVVAVEEPPAAEATPMPVEAEANPETPSDAEVPVDEPSAEEPAAEPTELPPTPTPEVVEEPPTPTPVPKLVISIPSANVRNGPGTNYGLAGAVNQDQAFDIVGKNPEGTWWQFCCVNGQEVWIFGDLVNTENAETVAIAESIPEPPPVAAAPPAEAAPANPPQPEPAEPEPEAPAPEPAGAVNAGGCGGDDGCKFRVTGGPSVVPNGGFELKFQLLFIHSGVDGGQPQGDYRLGIEKDGQMITRFADAKSIALTKNQGPQGEWNYEAKLGSNDLPGGRLEGRYYFWVLDGNRERDSEVYTLDLDGQNGEVYIKFDQG